MTARIILNPYSGRYTGRRRWPEAQAALEAAGLAHELALTERPGHARELAHEAARAGYIPIVAAGGDGTVSEVVNGLADAAVDGQPLGPLGILPVGTANDIVDTLGIPRDLGAAARVLAHGHARLMDLGEVNGRLFVNNSAIGLEPFVTLIQQRYRRIQGPPRYLLAALRGIAARPRWNMRLEWDGGASYAGPVSLVAIGNGPRSGGLFYMAPHADPVDGRLTFVYGVRAGRLQLLRLLPRTMRPGVGSYVEMDGISEIHTTWLRARIDPPAPAHADGEVFAPAIDTLEYRVLPARLQVLVP
jgi:diacylglycerol kinase (ATP)